MKKPEIVPMCCGKDSVWVDNVPTKEYFYCRECKNEVATIYEVVDVTREDPYGFIYYTALVATPKRATKIDPFQPRVCVEGPEPLCLQPYTSEETEEQPHDTSLHSEASEELTSEDCPDLD